MSTHSIVEAKNRLSELIDRALAGEGVVITPAGGRAAASPAAGAQDHAGRSRLAGRPPAR